MARREAKRRFGTDNVFTLRSEVGRVRNETTKARRARIADRATDEHVGKVMKHSKRNGNIFIVSDLHWGQGGDHDSFRDSDAFAGTVDHISRQQNSTLVIGGDFLELVRPLNRHSTTEQIDAVIGEIADAHRVEIEALATAVVDRGLRVLYIHGNHDVQLVEPEVRESLMRQMIRVARLDKKGAVKFRKRIAWSGQAVVLGRYGEGIVVHGHQTDAVSKWRSPANPYVYERQGDASQQRKLGPSLSWRTITNFVTKTEMDHSTSIGEIIRTLPAQVRELTGDRGIGGLLGSLFAVPESADPATMLASAIDDRLAMRTWVKRTGFDRKMNKTLFDGESRTVLGWARALDAVDDKMPRPLLSYLKSPRTLRNAIATGARVVKWWATWGSAKLGLFEELAKLGNVRYVVWGHDHLETVHLEATDGKGEIGHINSGSWVESAAGWTRNVIVASTDEQGRLHMTGPSLGLHRADGATGEISPIAQAQPLRKQRGLKRGKERGLKR